MKSRHESNQTQRRRRRQLAATLPHGVGIGRVLQVEPIAEPLRRRFSRGDPLAVFECLRLWRDEGLPFSSLPNWAAQEWGRIGAAYYERWIDSQLAKTRLPSFDRVSGLSRGRKSHNALRAANREAMAQHLKLRYDLIVSEAREGKGPPFEFLCDANTYQASRGPVRVLNKRGEPTQAFLTALATTFRIAGNSANAIYRNAQRLLRLASK